MPLRNDELGKLTDRLLELGAVDSTTGQEDRLLPVLRRILGELGAVLHEQTVLPGRTNLLATWGEPEVLFSTHVDTVPPHSPIRRDGDRFLGRGSCDAKGQIVVQLAAIERLIASGTGNLAWLGVVDEERGSLGAKAALDLKPRLCAVRAVINGEPTENRLATGQRGILTLELKTKGRAAHSGTPQLGSSATWPLLDWLQALRGVSLPEDKDLGPEIWNLGLLKAGAAPNIVPADAEATLMARTLPDSRFENEVRLLAPDGASVTVLARTEPDRFPRIDGFEAVPVPFGSDAPRLRELAIGRTIALVGPGSIEVAHTDHESITLPELERGTDLLVTLARSFLTRNAT